MNVGEKYENARRKKLTSAFISSVAIGNFAALRNSNGYSGVHSNLLSYGRKEDCANTGSNCMEIFHLGAIGSNEAISIIAIDLTFIMITITKNPYNFLSQ